MDNSYTQKEIDFITANHDKLSSYRIGAALSRTQPSISNKIRRLGLKTGPTSQQLQKEGLRKCDTCKKVLDISLFYRLKSSRYACRCIACAKLKAMEHHKQRYGSIEKYAETMPRVLSKRKPCFLTKNEILSQHERQKGKCFYSGVALKLEYNQPETISVDRVDSTKPYQKDNIVLCCHVVNMMKQSLSMDDFLLWCDRVCQNKLTQA